jgi:hypothetical protein
MSGELRLGRWQDVLADVECDALICDPPYSDRNHKGYNAGTGKAKTSTDGKVKTRDEADRTLIAYSHFAPEDVHTFVSHWSPRTRGWMACMTSHDLIPSWEAAYREAGRLPFSPVPCVISGMGVRLMGDGPCSDTVYLVVARPRAKRFLKWGALPGHYLASRASGSGGGRGKPLDLMRAIIRDYSRPGDLIGDPTAGLATTGVAALTIGRRFIGAEMDPETHAKGAKRLDETQVVDLFDDARTAKQESLL